MKLEVIQGRYSVCKLSEPILPEGADFFFFARTDRELSLVCPTERAPGGCRAREDGFSMFRVAGQLDFSLVGILSRITAILAGEDIGVFAISTFDTDYLLVKSDRLDQALAALRAEGYEIA